METKKRKELIDFIITYAGDELDSNLWYALSIDTIKGLKARAYYIKKYYKEELNKKI